MKGHWSSRSYCLWRILEVDAMERRVSVKERHLVRAAICRKHSVQLEWTPSVAAFSETASMGRGFISHHLSLIVIALMREWAVSQAGTACPNG